MPQRDAPRESTGRPEPARPRRPIRFAAIRLRPRRHRPPGRGLRAALPERVELAHAVKANPALAIVAHLGGLGLGADLSSDGELATALRAGIPPGGSS
ncbi:MAG: hypothetical protein H0U52_14545 [Chloroflexi bacterium]|nr:hypothetical protein [Chloroflexota bacterium]